MLWGVSLWGLTLAMDRWELGRRESTWRLVGFHHLNVCMRGRRDRAA